MRGISKPLASSRLYAGHILLSQILLLIFNQFISFPPPCTGVISIVCHMIYFVTRQWNKRFLISRPSSQSVTRQNVPLWLGPLTDGTTKDYDDLHNYDALDDNDALDDYNCGHDGEANRADSWQRICRVWLTSATGFPVGGFQGTPTTSPCVAVASLVAFLLRAPFLPSFLISDNFILCQLLQCD